MHKIIKRLDSFTDWFYARRWVIFGGTVAVYWLIMLLDSLR